MNKLTPIAALLAVSLSGCEILSQSNTQQVTAEVQQSESEKANALFDAIFMEGVMRSPIYQTYLGIKDDYDKWDDMSEANTLKELAHNKAALARLRAINVDALDANTKVSYDLLEQRLQAQIDDFKWRHYGYPVNQMFGTHSMIPSFLINQHQITNEAEARAYISRLNGVKGLLAQLQEDPEARAEKGIIAPKFVFPHVIESSKNILKGAPFLQVKIQRYLQILAVK